MWFQFLSIWLCNLTIYGVTPPVEFGIGKQLLVITDIKVESIGQLISITGQNFPLLQVSTPNRARGQRVFEVVDGIELCPIGGDLALINAWKKKNNASRAILATSIDMEHNFAYACGIS